MEKKVKIDRKVLLEICDAILSHDGYSDEGYDCFYTGRGKYARNANCRMEQNMRILQ